MTDDKPKSSRSTSDEDVQAGLSDFSHRSNQQPSSETASPPTDSPSHQPKESNSPLHENSLNDISNGLSSDNFNQYWFSKIEQRNEEENHHERNDPAHSWPIGRIEPHQIGNCKRKWFYRWLNAPQEQSDPHGIFAVGHFIEEKIIEEWLKDTFEPDYFIDNAVHVGLNLGTIPLEDSQTSPDSGRTNFLDKLNISLPYNQGVQSDPTFDANSLTLTIAGSTDPLIRDEKDGEPIALTEVKTTRNLTRQNGPKQQHLYQLHTYLKALELTTGFLIYVDRNRLTNPKIFEVEFSEEVWDDVTSWAESTARLAMRGELPPADPPESWMCDYCEFANRCGRGRSNTAEDMSPKGFVPGYTGYPERKVKEHLTAFEDVKLTPSLALEYPHLAESYSVDSWACPNCTAEFDPSDERIAGFENELFNTPLCPACETVLDTEIHLTTKSMETASPASDKDTASTPENDEI